MNMERRLRRRAHGRGRGQAMVEFALIIPIFLLLLVALFDLGRAVFAYNTLTNAAREGARMAIVNQYEPSIIQRAKNASAIVELNVPDVEVHFWQSNDDGTPDTTTPCDRDSVGHPKPVAVGCLAVVSFEATYFPITPIVSNILFKNGVTFKATSMLSAEYSCPPTDPTSGVEAAACPKQP
jgi:Flp pilus assembly protein TadG